MNETNVFQNDQISVYIPHVDTRHNKRTVIDIFNEFDIGQVERADFVQHSACEGYELFVHFVPYYTPTMDEIIQQHSIGGAYRIMVSINEQWTICQNHRPVPDTKLNIHQLAKHSKELEAKLDELRNAVAILPEVTSTLQSLNARIQYLEDPEWMNSMCEPLSMSDLATTSRQHVSSHRNTVVSPIKPDNRDIYDTIQPFAEDWSTVRSNSIVDHLHLEMGYNEYHYYEKQNNAC